ncbi:class I lanthipeptide [Hymenobacter lucidus]|uniref:Class I lanthipeptide n=1 Tax=Hymenobacter lucidus TaxID=2880930 RepID=A0ABS8AUV1_9BACT|nr:class I lanthipeptide [Hymenobacter lucidus]MCB2409843.1 class I lanthipeptide [Hymenobacter lucidus]MCB2409844.1 class I lanthipeptide [Hymenobacter lucidus]
MKKQDSKLAFNKEKVANLSSADLDQVVGGKEAATHPTDGSTHANFTCSLCTTLTGIAPEEQA